MTEPDHGYFAAPNLDGGGKHRLHYLDWGSHDAKNTVICVHGLTRNAHDFDYLAPALVARGHRVLALDMPGRGDSDRLSDPYGYSYPAYMADCLAFLDNFHLRKVDWVGTSMGGIIGMMIAAMNPGRIKRLVLNDVGSFIPAAGLKTILDYVRKAQPSYATRAEAEAQLRQNLATFGIDEEEHWQHLFRYSLKETDNGSVTLAFDPAILEPIRAETQDFTAVTDVNLGELWEGANIPTLVLRGAESTLLEADTVRAMRVSNLKCHAIEIPGVGHAPMLLKPAEYNHVVNWLSGSALMPTK